MATETSSIDDLLLGNKTITQPQTPEHHEEAKDTFEVHEETTATDTSEDAPEAYDDVLDTREPAVKDEVASDDESDDYGNTRPKDNEVIRERLARQAESMKRQHQAELDALRAQLTPQQNQAVNQAAEGFNYDENSNQSWDQQLRSFVEHTVQGMTQRQAQEAQATRDRQAQMEFENKFRDDVQRFPDFQQTIVGVGAQISDPMVYATRGMKNPAAFLYAAAKRAPQELQRISNIKDPYVQVAEMGRLEASLRQTKPATKAPRPLSKSHEDLTIPHKSDKEPTIEELIARSDVKRRALQSQRRR